MKRVCLILLAMVMLVGFTGCPYIQVNPNSQVAKYETFGRSLGTYFKNANPEFVEKSKAYITGALALSDADLFAANVLETAYEYAMKHGGKNKELIALIKMGFDLYGVKIDLSSIAPDDRPVYVDSVRALLKGFAETSKAEF